MVARAVRRMVVEVVVAAVVVAVVAIDIAKMQTKFHKQAYSFVVLANGFGTLNRQRAHCRCNLLNALKRSTLMKI